VKIEWDVGKPGGDHNAISAKCPNCAAVWTVTWPAEVLMLPMGLSCSCGKYYKFRGETPAADTGAKDV
jgi:hypothetical protein